MSPKIIFLLYIIQLLNKFDYADRENTWSTTNFGKVSCHDSPSAYKKKIQKKTKLSTCSVNENYVKMIMNEHLTTPSEKLI